MDLIKRLKEYFALTKNEQKVFLFLSIVFLAGVAVKAYKAYIVPQAQVQFDYSASDSAFLAKSAALLNDTATAKTQRVLKININGATKTELMTLPGIGESTAERIMLYREEKGRFKKLDDLKNVKGIGEKKFEKLKPHIEVK